MFHVEVNLIYICYLVKKKKFLMRPSVDQPDVPCGPRGEKFAHTSSACPYQSYGQNNVYFFLPGHSLGYYLLIIIFSSGWYPEGDEGARKMNLIMPLFYIQDMNAVLYTQVCICVVRNSHACTVM